MKIKTSIRAFIGHTRRAIRVWQVDGFRTLLKAIYHKLKKPGVSVGIPLMGKNKILNFYDFINIDIDLENKFLDVVKQKSIICLIDLNGLS